MAFKPNYNQQRAERNRAAQAKKDAKQQEREAAVARRKAGQSAQDPSGQDPSTQDGAAPDQTAAATTPDAGISPADMPSGS